MAKTALALAVLLLTLPCQPWGQQNRKLNSLDAFIEKQLVDYRVPGLAIGVINNKRALLKEGYGVTSLTDPAPVTSQTIFPILSCTKAFTGAAIGILVDGGKLRWDDKVIEYLPDFALNDPWITKELTIVDILSHRSGLSEFDGDLLWYGTAYSQEEVLDRIRHYPVKKNFRADFAYQNVMYLAAGAIIEAVTGATWGDFIEEQLFSPLSMEASSTSISGLPPGAYAHPHLNNKTIPMLNMDNIAPAGAINSNVEEMLHWLELWLNQGVWRDRTILSKRAFQTITTPKIMVSARSDEAYGIGWHLQTKDGQRIMSHGGGLPGYKSSIAILPDQGIGIVILANAVTYLVDELTSVIIDFLIEPANTDWEQADKNLQFKNFRFSWENDRPAAESQRANLPSGMAGVYEDDVYGQAEIREKEGKAFLSLIPSKNLLSGFLYEFQRDTFTVVFEDKFLSPGRIIFDKDAEGQFQGFKIDLPSGDFHFEYLNFRKAAPGK